MFFAAAASQLRLTTHTRMLDVGCGPGNLAIGFASFLGFCEAVDIEPEMLRVARENATRAGVAVTFYQLPIEELNPGPSSLDLITIGRAIHWLNREATLSVFERAVAQGGRIAVCNSAPVDAPWVRKFKEVRRAWSSDSDESRYRPNLDLWFAPSRFRKVEEISVTQQNPVTIDDLVNRGLSFSVTSPLVLGERRPRFEAQMRSALQEFASNGVIEEQVTAKAIVFG